MLSFSWMDMIMSFDCLQRKVFDVTDWYIASSLGTIKLLDHKHFPIEDNIIITVLQVCSLKLKGLEWHVLESRLHVMRSWNHKQKKNMAYPFCPGWFVRSLRHMLGISSTMLKVVPPFLATPTLRESHTRKEISQHRGPFKQLQFT